jgi:2-polyprenyl-6-methoxyphenol hydroxylase-like FAD-dependent oxidoreductase
MRVLVAGGGIGGLAAAIACSRAGMEVEVMEQASELGEVGTGLTLWPNGLLGLRRLGVELPDPERPIRRLRMSRAGGGDFATVDVHGLEARHGAGILAVPRATLLAALRGMIPSGALRLGSQVTGYRPAGDRIELQVAGLDGSREAAGDMLIGADGISSTVRGQLLGDAGPRPLGALAWRCIVDLPSGTIPPDEARQVWGRGGEFGWIPLLDGRTYWFCAERLKAPEPRSARDPAPSLIERFGSWAPEIAPIISASDESAIVRTELLARSVPRRWSRGPVALLGDAAHGMAPNLGQGACQALEDAVVLGRVLKSARHPAAALREYSRARMPRAKAVSAVSAWTGALLYVDNGLLWRIRDAVFTATPSRALRLQLDRIVTSRALRS